MKKIIFILFLLAANNLIAQTDKTNSLSNTDSLHIKTKDEIVRTPFGPAFKSRVHYVKNGQCLNIKDGKVQIINKSTGLVCREFDGPLKENTLEDANNSVFKSNSKDDGWITYSVWHNSTVHPISLFSTKWVVPSSPAEENDQLIYLFNGLCPVTNTKILQPVLQWGTSPAGGGNYWSITNWFVSSDGDYFCGSLVAVNPGDTLEGIMQLTSTANFTYSYHSYFTGYLAGCDLQVNNLTEVLTEAYETLEVYYTDDYEYPADTMVKMFDIQLLTDGIYPALNWTPYDYVTDIGQHTNIVSNSPNGGEVDIYFHSPFDLSVNSGITAQNDKILFYPNPSSQKLKIEAPEKTEIEILNLEGQLLEKTRMEGSYTTIDISGFSSGMYFIKAIKEKEISIMKFIKD